MDVHTTNYTICAFTMEGQKAFAQTTINPEFGELEKYLTTLNTQLGAAAISYAAMRPAAWATLSIIRL